MMRHQTMAVRLANRIYQLAGIFGILLFTVLSAVFQGISDFESKRLLAAASGTDGARDDESRTARRQETGEWLNRQAVEVTRTLRDADIRNAVVYHRVKSPESAAEKVRRKGLSSVEELNDLYGMRIVVRNELDVYRSLGVLCDRYDTVAGTIKNYIARPKASGYQSLHVVSRMDGRRVEFQIRTREMHEQAEAEHEAYKRRVSVA